MTEEGKVAAEAPAPAEPAAPAPAPTNESAPAPKEDPVALLESRIGEKLTATERSLLTRVDEAFQEARRAQSAADKNASKLRQEFDRRWTAFEALATRGMDENELRTWRTQTENARLLAERDSQDQDTRDRQAQEEFQSWSASVLAEEKIDANDPTFKDAWTRYAAAAKSPADWRGALGRAVATYRKSETEKAVQAERESAKKALEEERKKATNERREKAGPVDTGQPASTATKSVAEMSEAEFEVYSKRRKEERDRRLMGIGR